MTSCFNKFFSTLSASRLPGSLYLDRKFKETVKILRENNSKISTEMVFCYKNWFDLLSEKIVLVIEKDLKFEAEGREFAKYLRSLE